MAVQHWWVRKAAIRMPVRRDKLPTEHARLKAANDALTEEHVASADKGLSRVFSGRNFGQKVVLKERLFDRHAFRLELRRHHWALHARTGLGLIRNLHRLAIMTFQLCDLKTLLEMRRNRFTRQHTHL